jgi:hypothetical protein
VALALAEKATQFTGITYTADDFIPTKETAHD